MRWRWLTNTYDPKRSDWIWHLVTWRGQSQMEAAQEQLKWLSDKLIGDPKETDAYTKDELIKMGMVGIYTLEEEGS